MKYTTASYAVIGVLVLVVVLYRFLGTDNYSTIIEHLWDRPSDFRSEQVTCTISPSSILLKEYSQNLSLKVSQPLLFPFPKVAFSGSDEEHFLLLSDTFVIDTDTEGSEVNYLASQATGRFRERAPKLNNV